VRRSLDAERRTSTLGSFLDDKPAKEGPKSTLLPNQLKSALETSLPSALADRISDASGNLNTLRRGMTWMGELTPKHIRQFSGGGGGGRDVSEAEPDYEVEVHAVQESGIVAPCTLSVRWDAIILRTRKDGKAWTRSMHMVDVLAVTTGPLSVCGELSPQHSLAGLAPETQLLEITHVTGQILTIALATREAASRCIKVVRRRWRGLRALGEAAELEGNLLLLLPDGTWGVRRAVLMQGSLRCYQHKADAGEACLPHERLLGEARPGRHVPPARILLVEASPLPPLRPTCLRITLAPDRDGEGQRARRPGDEGLGASDGEASAPRVLVLDCLERAEAVRP
jgi:hypothetical protein